MDALCFPPFSECREAPQRLNRTSSQHLPERGSRLIMGKLHGHNATARWKHFAATNIFRSSAADRIDTPSNRLLLIDPKLQLYR